jgi:hypothetical protein
MKLFVSHAGIDVRIAKTLKLRLEEIPGIECFLSETDIQPGDDWEVRLRAAVQQCDGIACLVTPMYIARPWFYAEWAAFWFQQKTWYLLMMNTDLNDVFEVMRRRQNCFLNDRHSVQRLIEQLAGGRQLAQGSDILAAEIVKAVAEAQTQQERARAETNRAQLAVAMQGGHDNVAPELVGELLRAGQLDRILEIAKSQASNSAVKLRQLAVALVGLGHASAVSAFDERIANAERKNLGLACLDRLNALKDDDALALVVRIYSGVRDPQRKNLRERAQQLGLAITWPQVEPNP